MLLNAFVLGVVLFGCTPGVDPQTSIHVEVPWINGKKVWIEMLQADLDIQGQSSSVIIVEGITSNPDVDFKIDEDENNIWISIGHGVSDELVHLDVSLPHGSNVEITQLSGTALLHNYEGQLRYESISADVYLDLTTGIAYLTTRRGSIHITDSQGEIHALAEADEIVLTDLRGDITATNIMGNITFSGLLTDGDSARFETDHGAVQIKLYPESATHINLISASGRIVCTLPGMAGTLESCEGQFGDGGGSLEIRTVSGAIRLDLTP